MKKLTLLLSAMLFSMMSFAAVVTFDADADKGNAGTDSNAAAAYTITKDGVTLTVSSGILGTYSGEMHYRIYKNQTLTVTSTVGAITSVEFTCTAKNDAKYGPGCFTWSVGDYTYVDAVGTWSGSAAEVVFTASSNQVRASQIVVAIDGSVIPDNGGDDNGGDDNGGDDNGGTTPVDPGKTTIVIPAEAQGWNIPAEAIDVLQARAICASLASGATTGTKYYVMGYVKKLHKNHESGVSGYGNATFYMENVKGAGSEEDFLAFQVYGLNGEKMTDPTAVEVGDFVVIYGELTNYMGDTYETVGKGAAYIWNSTNPKLGSTETPELPTDLIGDGTEANPFTVADVIKLNNLLSGKHYVKGFIIGQVNGASISAGLDTEAPFVGSENTDGTIATQGTNLIIADAAGDTTVIVPVALPKGELRDAFNLVEHPEMLGQEVLICGSLEKYFGVAGVKSPSSIVVLTPQDPNLVTIKGLEYADAFYEAYNNTWLIYLYPETEEFDPEVHTNLTLIITPKSSTAINGTYDLQAAMYFVSETDHVSGFDSTKPASVTIKNIDNGGNYSFVGSFVGEDAKTYTFDQVVNVYAMDSETEEEIVLEETNTAVENVYVGENPVKFIENGQLMIIRGENVYNVLGAQVK